ncbi:methylmalonyl-CoA epimerase [Cerasibacillus sp. JNUCC 74]|uniref:methylmalonyl-CoA epimerase n=1 Tax=Virgibacillus proomii TaxID=84407 RepID=UPI002481B329|nr:methylmalonyl-CoA epimerase [Virgibacillus proomii]
MEVKHEPFIKHVAHIGIAVRNMEETLPFYIQTLGLQVEHLEILEKEQVLIAFLSVGNSYLELLQPTTTTSTIYQFIEKHGEGIHHIALEVEGLSERIIQLNQAGIPFIDEEPRHGAKEKMVAFIHPKATNGVLVELCESRKI